MAHIRTFIDPRYPDLEMTSTWNGVPYVPDTPRPIDDQFGASSLVCGASAGQPAKGSRGVNTAATRGAVR